MGYTGINMAGVKSDFDSGAFAVPKCTLCGWSVRISMPKGTSPKKVTERANEVMSKHLKNKHGVLEKGVSKKSNKWM